MKNIYEVHVEIAKDSNIKYEYSRSSNKFIIDRILRDGFKYPANYGFLPEALDWDGDELDVLIFTEEKFLPGTVARVRIVGAMKMIDDGETDTKLIAVHADDYRLEKYKKLKDLPESFLDEVKTFFSTYKNWKRKDITVVSGFENEKWAMEEYQECVQLMEKYGKLDKKEFIKLMMKMHPEKYTN